MSLSSIHKHGESTTGLVLNSLRLKRIWTTFSTGQSDFGISTTATSDDAAGRSQTAILYGLRSVRKPNILSLTCLTINVEWLIPNKTALLVKKIMVTSKRLIDTACIMEMQTVWEKDENLGETVDELELGHDFIIYKHSRLSMYLPTIMPHLKELKNILLVGIEAHVCILQTTMNLLKRGFNAHVVVGDAL